MEEENWSNQILNQEVFERLDDVIETTAYLVNINQSGNGFPLEDNKKFGELAEILKDKYRGKETYYVDKGV